MNVTLTIATMSFAFIFLLEGIAIAFKKNVNIAYKISHILYPLFMVGVMIYFLAAGVITE